MSEVLKITFANCSDLGLKRTENQDYFGKFPKTSDSLALPKGQLFVVADGMGGHLGGREASRLAVDTLGEVYYSEPAETIVSSLQRAMEEANQRIHAQSVGNPHFRGMGTTCTALVLKDDRAYIAHVGDSRAYRITAEKIEQLTQDHSKVAEMQRLGILTEEEAKRHPDKSHLYRALGTSAKVQIDIIDDISFNAGEYFLLCTDGLGKVEDAEIQTIVLSNSPHQACQRLVELANERGGSDNITLQIIRIESAAPAPAGGMWSSIRSLWTRK